MTRFTYSFSSSFKLQLLNEKHQHQDWEWYVSYGVEVLKAWFKARLDVDLEVSYLSTKAQWKQYIAPLQKQLSTIEWMYMQRLPSYVNTKSEEGLTKLFTILENLVKLTNTNIKVTFIAQTSATPTSVPPSFPNLSWIDKEAIQKKAVPSCAKQAPNTSKTPVADPMVGSKPVATEVATDPVIPACPAPAELLLKERFAPADPEGILAHLYFLEEHCQTLRHNPYLDPRSTSALLVCIRIECEELLNCLLGTQTTWKPLAERLLQQNGFPVQTELAFHGIRQICNLGAHCFLDLSQYPGAREQLLGYLYILMGWGKSLLSTPFVPRPLHENRTPITYH